MRKGTHIFMAFVLAGGASCSLVTSFDGLPVGQDEAGTTPIDDSGAGRDVDTPRLDGGPGAEDAGLEDVAPSPDAACPLGEYKCASRFSEDAPENLMQCGADGARTALFTCKRGCAQRIASSDSCRCFPMGRYCGMDQVVGDTKTLYRCKSNGLDIEVIKICPKACVIFPNDDDDCAP